jgi:hypothetical protein
MPQPIVSSPGEDLNSKSCKNILLNEAKKFMNLNVIIVRLD